MTRVMQMSLFRIGIIAIAYSFFNSCSNSEATTPNVVFFLVDDMGWKDLTCYGSDFYETPNIDRLAADGVKFTNAYAACPVCSPTRASILTGKYPASLNITDWIPGYDPKNLPLLGTKDKHELPLEEETIAEVFKKAGYTTAFYGKWHLGEPDYFPENQGFDINIGGHWAGQPASYFYPYKNDRKRWDVPGLTGGHEGEYLTDRLTQESLKFIENNKDNPFLVYLSYYSVHTPIQAKPELKEKYEMKLAAIDTFIGPSFVPERTSLAKQHQDRPDYAAMVQSVDESVGNIISKLEELGLTDNTIIVFTSDNGGLTTLPGKRSPTSVLPLRAGKGWLYEGGIRVPLIVKWPGKIPAGEKREHIVSSVDFYPTLLELTGKKSKITNQLDGMSLASVLKENDILNREAIYWHFPHYHGSGNKPSAAIRKGVYKLITWYEDNSLELYNLADDPGEHSNLVESMPEKRDELFQNLKKWQRSTGALFPSKNSNFGKDQSKG